MKNFALFLGAVALAAAPVGAQIRYGESVPVQLEESDGLDPCALGVIADVGPDSSAMVLAGPGSEYEAVDYLSDGDMVWVCQLDGDHLGIVYSTDTETDCEVSSPVETTVNYSGPCSTGWVKADWVGMVAG